MLCPLTFLYDCPNYPRPDPIKDTDLSAVPLQWSPDEWSKHPYRPLAPGPSALRAGCGASSETSASATLPSLGMRRSLLRNEENALQNDVLFRLTLRRLSIIML